MTSGDKHESSTATGSMAKLSPQSKVIDLVDRKPRTDTDRRRVGGMPPLRCVATMLWNGWSRVQILLDTKKPATCVSAGSGPDSCWWAM